MSDVPHNPRTSSNSQWQSDAACQGLGDDLFFATSNERGASRRHRERAAKAVCATCPVVDPCLAWALAASEPYGVWGGQSPEERSRLKSRNRRASPDSEPS
jgi:WhiB family transcriptional regulator, redox-sensing transcriptional regulator